MADRRTESWRPRSQVSDKQRLRELARSVRTSRDLQGRSIWRDLAGELRFQSLGGALRKFLDLQTGSIWRDVSAELPAVRGTVLDVGCGAQPFRHLFHESVRYIGIDTTDAKQHFDYEVPDTLYYDGRIWPVDDGSIDFILCTEAMEHVYDTRQFLAEARRCLAHSGQLLITVPFAARWHYIPHDYWRFTPSSLKNVLTEAGFRSVAVYARGNEITVACYKLMALLLPLLLPQGKRPGTALVLRLFGLLLLPVFFLLAACGNLSFRSRGGDDCLGYTVLAQGSEQ